MNTCPVPTLPLVLVVDDELGPRLASRFVLRTRGVCETIMCESPAEALAALAANPAISAAVVDFDMPGMTGAELTRQLQAVRPGLRTVLYTGRRNEGIPPSDLPIFFAVLQKPTSNDRLAETVRAALRADAAPPPMD